jgi:hypothetical protein
MDIGLMYCYHHLNPPTNLTFPVTKMKDFEPQQLSSLIPYIIDF